MGEKTTSRDQFTCLSIAISFKTKEIDVVSGGGWTDLNREKRSFCRFRKFFSPPELENMSNQLILCCIFIRLTYHRMVLIHRLLITCCWTIHFLKTHRNWNNSFFDLSVYIAFRTTNHSLIDGLIRIAFGMRNLNRWILTQSTNILFTRFQWIQTIFTCLKKNKDELNLSCSFSLSLSLSRTYSIFVEFIPFELREHKRLFFEN